MRPLVWEIANGVIVWNHSFIIASSQQPQLRGVMKLPLTSAYMHNLHCTIHNAWERSVCILSLCLNCSYFVVFQFWNLIWHLKSTLEDRKLRIKEVYNSLSERLDFVSRHTDISLEGDCWLDIDSWQFLGINQIINYLTYFMDHIQSRQINIL